MKFLFVMLICSMMATGNNPDIVSVKGPDTFAATRRAVEGLGGMQAFVKPGQKVGILVNSNFREKGAYVDPDVVLAVLEMIYEAGAGEVVSLKIIEPEYWTRSSLEPLYRDMISQLRIITHNTGRQEFDEQYFVRLGRPEGGKAVNNLEIVREVFEVDVFINVAIAKHHIVPVLTNAMKNLMGLNTRAANVNFHLEGPERNDPHFLAQCIADLNLLRKPDLIVSDVTTVIVTNGPGGPGDLVHPGKVVASADPVAIDAYCALQVGFLPEDVPTIALGHEMGLGEKNLEKLKITEITLDEYQGQP